MKALRIVAVSLFALTAARSAQATPISFTDTFDPVDVLFDGQSSGACVGNNGTDTVTGQASGACETLSWTHVLSGFNPATDILSSGILTITAYDGATQQNGQDFTLTMDALNGSGSIPDGSAFGGANTTFPFTVTGQLADGQLVVNFTGQNGNHTFYFAKSILDAAGTRGEVGVTNIDVVATPEPASLMLLGTGLIFAGNRLRSRRSKAGRTI